MKKIVLLLLAVAMVFAAFSGCAQDTVDDTAADDTAADNTTTDTVADDTAADDTAADDTAADDTASDETSEYKYPGAVGKKITLILKDLTNPVWIKAAEGAEAAAAEFGMEIDCIAPVESNNNDEQIALIQQTIAENKDLLIMIPADSTGIVPAIEEINAAGIPVINLNTKINTDGNNAKYETFVVADNTICGTLCAEELAKLAGEQGEAVILEGPSGGQVTIDLSNAAQAVFNKYAGIEIVDIQNAKFDRATGYETTLNLFQAHPDIKIIFSCNDEMALGAVQALEELGKLDDVVVGGIDGNADALAAIKEGRMEVTVNKNFWLQAYTAVEAAAMYFDGVTLDDLILVDLAAVTIDNVDEFIK